MYLPFRRNPRLKKRGKTNRLQAKRAAKNRRRVNRMRGKSLGRRLRSKW